MSSALQLYVYDPLERAASTAVQQFSVIILAGGTMVLISAPWATALWTALFAGIISILTSVLTFPVPKLSIYLDIALRVFKSGLQSFVGTLVAANVVDVIHANWKGALAVAIPVMLTALLKAGVALALPWSDGASLVPEMAGSTTGGGDEALLDLVIPEDAAASAAARPSPGGRHEAPEAPDAPVLGRNPD